MTEAQRMILDVLRSADRGELPLRSARLDAGARPETVVSIRAAVERGFLREGGDRFQTTPKGASWRSALVASILDAAGVGA